FFLDTSPDVVAKQLCYIWNTEAGDKAMLSMDIRGDNVIGEFYFLPFEKDSKVGIFKGVVSPLDENTNKKTVYSIWETKAEGATVKEEFYIIYEEGGVASPGFGEMQDRGDGVYLYADPEKVSYPINLQQTDCGDEAMD
ncbi:hypothetical protein K8Q98_02035, partial [Candidatus Nomurabacteria bacterium]|nr:hypothetical protein [Candidatus Nomurabacteria bacterium]